MKIKIPLVAFLFLSFQAFPQTKNNISLVYGIASNYVDIHGAIGDFGYDTQHGQTVGLSYTRSFSKVFSIETGFLYSDNKYRENSILGGIGTVYHNGDVKMMSVPVYAKLTFLKYLFAQGGFSADLMTNYSRYGAIDNQSGLGFELGFGGKCNFGPVSVFINPFFARHAITGQNNLMEGGVKLGAGYNF